MRVITESGSFYTALGKSEPRFGIPLWQRNGEGTAFSMIGIYPDRREAFEASVRWELWPDGRLAGFNQAGTRTGLYIIGQIRPGMILVNPRGGRSTRIVEVRR